MMWPGGLPLWMEPVAEYIMQLLKEPGYNPQPCLPPPCPRPLPHPLTALAAAFPWNILSFLGLELYTFNSARVSLGNLPYPPQTVLYHFCESPELCVYDAFVTSYYHDLFSCLPNKLHCLIQL